MKQPIPLSVINRANETNSFPTLRVWVVLKQLSRNTILFNLNYANLSKIILYLQYYVRDSIYKLLRPVNESISNMLDFTGLFYFMKLIPLSQTGKHAGKYFVQVDDSDYEELNNHKWCALIKGRNIYARRTVKEGGVERTILLHRHILGINDNSIFIDHEDHDGLNCQRSNLREATSSMNSQNQRKQLNRSSLYKGVSKILRVFAQPTFVSKINIKRKQIHIGYFKCEVEAARAYDAKAKELFGEFANLNFK